MNLDRWLVTVPTSLSKDALWRMSAYRLSTYVADLVGADAALLRRARLGLSTIDQLTRAVGSVGANLSEGYSRSSGVDRVRFFEYALGSTRESLHWYFLLRRGLPPADLTLRMTCLTQVRRILLTAIPQERGRAIRPSST